MSQFPTDLEPSEALSAGPRRHCVGYLVPALRVQRRVGPQSCLQELGGDTTITTTVLGRRWGCCYNMQVPALLEHQPTTLSTT